MQLLKRAAPFVLGSLLLACDGPTAPDPLASASPALSRAGSSSAACYPVRFHALDEGFVGDPFTIAGTFTGDVDGSFLVRQDPSTLKLAGKTAHIGGTFSMTITDGRLPVPLPLTFTGTFEQLNQNRVTPASPATVFEQTVSFRATNGVKRANLAMHGSFDAVTVTVDHDFWGVICP